MEYYLQLFNVYHTRTYFLLSALIFAVNTFIYEILYLSIYSQVFSLLVILISGFSFLGGSIVTNLRDQYVIPYLEKKNYQNILKKLELSNPNDVRQLGPDIIPHIVQNGNDILANMVFLTENLIGVAFKIIISVFAFLLFRPRFIFLLFIQLILVGMNIMYILKKEKLIKWNNDKLNGLDYYLTNGKISYLLEILEARFNVIVSNITSSKLNSFSYIHVSIVSFYILFGFNSFDFDTKLFLVMYVRNSSNIFGSLQHIMTYYSEIIKKVDDINIVLALPHFSKLEQIPFGKIEMDNVKSGNITIDKLTIIPGDKIIVFGGSGSGKSTLLDTIKGLHDVIGVIKINGKYESFNKIYDQVMLVRSDSFNFFKEKIIDFIVENKEIDELLIDKLLKIVELDLPDLIRYINKFELSSGQMKRLVLVKVLYQFQKSEKSMLLLDEMDNGIDSKLFISILEKMFALFKNRTILIVSHDPNLQNKKYAYLFHLAVNVDNNKVITKRLKMTNKN